VSLVVRVTTAPPVGAALERVTVATDGEPPTTDVGLSVSVTLWAWAKLGKSTANTIVRSRTISRFVRE